MKRDKLALIRYASDPRWHRLEVEPTRPACGSNVSGNTWVLAYNLGPAEMAAKHNERYPLCTQCF